MRIKVCLFVAKNSNKSLFVAKNIKKWKHAAPPFTLQFKKLLF